MAPESRQWAVVFPNLLMLRSTKKRKVGTKSGRTKHSSFFAAPPKCLESGSREIDLEDLPLVRNLRFLRRSSTARGRTLDIPFAGCFSQNDPNLPVKPQRILFAIEVRWVYGRTVVSDCRSWLLVAPLRTIHTEPKGFTANKSDPNERKFYICSRFAPRFATRVLRPCCDQPVDRPPPLRSPVANPIILHQMGQLHEM